MMNKNDFITITIKGRIAFAICCFENALKHYNYKTRDWRIVLEQLWTYTNIEFFDDWHYATVEFLPESILEFNTYKEENFEYINEEQFNILHKIYNDSNDTVKNIIKMIFEIGISEFYGRLQNYGQRTLDNLDILINYMMLNSISLPDINMFMAMKYDNENGWGNDFDGAKFSSIL